MDRITKVLFDPLATTKAQIRALLQEENVAIGTAHPFSPEKILLHRNATGIEEIDISSYDEHHFFNAVDLGELGQILQTRMTCFEALKLFNNEYTVQQAPKSTFKVPIDAKRIAMLAVSERKPNYYDFCVADADCKTESWAARNEFSGVSHSGDIMNSVYLLHHIKITEGLQAGKEFAAFVSGYEYTKLTEYRQHTPVVMIANHEEKLLYIVPVPLDTASIGDATICTPLVFKREGDSLICNILPTTTTDLEKMCSGPNLPSTSFNEAIQRADWTIVEPLAQPTSQVSVTYNVPDTRARSEETSSIPAKQNAVFVTQTTVLPPFISLETTQAIRFGTGLEFLDSTEQLVPAHDPSAVVLPCVFGSKLEGPLLLATGNPPESVPYHDAESLQACYKSFENVIVFVDERMADNARNLASSWRMNAVFVIQMNQGEGEASDVKALLDLVNINAITALAGPQSLVLVQISGRYFFYRGIANQALLDTSMLAFGSDVSAIVDSTGLKSLIDPRVGRIVNLREPQAVLLPKSGQVVQPQNLEDLFKNLSLDQMQTLEDDIGAMIPQLQVLLNQKELQDLSRILISVLSTKVNNATRPCRDAYVNYLTKEYDPLGPSSVTKKNMMLSDYRKSSQRLQRGLESIISQLDNMMSSQTTSKRTHDLQRLQRQATIKNNVEAVKSMTYEKLAVMLESKAEEMGVMLLDIETVPYKELLSKLKYQSLDAGSSCSLNSRVLFLEGLDAGIILEQSQINHSGPLKHQNGLSHPCLALSLSQTQATNSMLAWVCWDEFVNLKSPFTVRWMEKCNDSHVSALRIMMRDTLSYAVSSRQYNLQPGSQETGQLMSALLMAAMSKLAAMKTTAPERIDKAEDTVTKLMRGLFGNLLTIAGSGVRPMSMVWQLFGKEPKFDVPSSDVAWSWYEKVVMLYPYTGWAQDQFNLNLEKLLDKALISIVTKNEITKTIRLSRMEWMTKYCKLRNIQLDHSRTIVTIFFRMMETGSDCDRTAIAKRLLAALPRRLEKQSKSYTAMIRYLDHIAGSGSFREQDNINIAKVYLKRSAAFKSQKQAVAKACSADDTDAIKKSCAELKEELAEVAKSLNLDALKLKVQNMAAYEGLLDEPCDTEISKTLRKEFMVQVSNDAEISRVPWQVGKPGEFGDDIEPLDEAFVHEILTGEKAPEFDLMDLTASPSTTDRTVKARGMTQFSSVVNQNFIMEVDSAMSADDVCKIMKIPVSAMSAFSTAINPEFHFEQDLGRNFKEVVISLLLDRKAREKQEPIRALFGLEKRMTQKCEGILLEAADGI